MSNDFVVVPHSARSVCSPIADRISDLEAASAAYACRPATDTAQALETARRNLHTAVIGHIEQQLADPRRRRLAALVLELADAVEGAAQDIGGHRPQLTILREAVVEARRVKGDS